MKKSLSVIFLSGCMIATPVLAMDFQYMLTQPEEYSVQSSRSIEDIENDLVIAKANNDRLQVERLEQERVQLFATVETAAGGTVQKDHFLSH